MSIVAIVSEIIFSTANWKEEGTERLFSENSEGVLSRLLIEIFSFFLLCNKLRVEDCSNARPERIMRRTRRVCDAKRSVKRKVICPSNSSRVDRNKLSIDTSFSESSASFESAVRSSVTTGADCMNNVSQQWLANRCWTKCAKLPANFSKSCFFWSTVLSSMSRSISLEHD